ncbi:hypothetical protein ED92_41805 [Amycolatopsis sp. MJM2582]|nr:hypothetical protein ED92_41805 [Amycolatopsis sp. MJM2582]
MSSEAAGKVRLTGEPLLKVSSDVFGRGQTQFWPVKPDAVEARRDASVATFASRLRPKVRRIRPDLTVHDLEI